MFYYLAELKDFFIGFNLFRYITFRATMAAVTTFGMCLVFAPGIIQKLKQLKVGEVAKRADCPDLDQFQESKEGTPTMGGVFVIGSILISILFWADMLNRYVLLTVFTAFFLAVLGFVDDYKKLKGSGKGLHRGLRKQTKLLAQIFLGCFVGMYVYLNPDTSTQLTVPFLKHVVLNLGVFYVLFVAVILIGSSNAVNLTDGLDGLAIGCVMIVGITMGILSYIVGHANFSEYLLIPFVSGAGELTVVCGAMVGACLGFLWFNCYPASIFMGDTGSLSLGGMLGVMAVFIKNELVLVIMGGIFVMEAVSVLLQVFSFRVFGKRIFKMTPIHHHFQLSGWKESQIITRFWIIGIILAMLALATLKLR